MIFAPPTILRGIFSFFRRIGKREHRKYLAKMKENVNSNMRFRQVLVAPNHMIMYIFTENRLWSAVLC